ncbi:PspC domain-containing protein [Paenibacillus sp. PL2-23]|uniref:PspC domain-containing protein n=1 Tax=Paenibacillus sp. PL2-23 TaxID=2100729 RepID=UPI0030F55AB4
MRKLYRSRRDKKILGLCGGLSDMLNVDATLLRILLIVITVLTSGTVIFIYIIAGLVVPKEPPVYGAFGPYGYGDGPGSGYGSSYGHQSGHQGPFQPFPPKGNGWDPGYHKSEPAGSQFDSMMDDLEKKALRREIEELKAKLAKQEKGE